MDDWDNLFELIRALRLEAGDSLAALLQTSYCLAACLIAWIHISSFLSFPSTNIEKNKGKARLQRTGELAKRGEIASLTQRISLSLSTGADP